MRTRVLLGGRRPPLARPPARSTRRLTPSRAPRMLAGRIMSAPPHYPHTQHHPYHMHHQQHQQGRDSLAASTVLHYQAIIDGVVARAKPTFAEEGVDE